jgi:uncharacterized membrane protein YfcA
MLEPRIIISLMVLYYTALLLLGVVIGGFGTLIGAGGGFILAPILLLLYPDDPPELITSISLAVVFFNALSGSWAYNRLKRVDYRSGIYFAIATIPGAILGAVGTSYVPRHAFNLLFGFVMVAAGGLLWMTTCRTQADSDAHDVQPGEAKRGWVYRDFADREGVRYRYAFKPIVGIVLSVFVGFLSSFLGVGGGFIHVPLLTHFLNFPVHIATATSHFVLAVMALAGTLVHIASGAFAHGARRTACLAIGVVIGAQIGARLSNKVSGKWIIRGLAAALGLVGLRLVFGEF